MTEVEEFNPFEDLEDTTTANDSKVVAGVVEDNNAGAVEIVKVMNQLEKDNRLNETLETLETVNEAPEQNKVENKQDNEQKVIKHRRTQGKKPKGEKGKMLRELKNIWSNKVNKGSDIVSSATLYAELMGWRLKTPQESLKGDIMSISFSKDDKSVSKPPSNKMLTGEQVENKSMPANTPTTTAANAPANNVSQSLKSL
jgi:hypothetical protein